MSGHAPSYDLLFRTAAETLTTLAADPKHLGARIGLAAVLHTWGSALTHHPHVHVIAPGDGARWIACKPGFFLPVRVLPRLFRRLFLEGLAALNQAGRLAFFGDLAPLTEKSAFDAALAPLRRFEWQQQRFTVHLGLRVALEGRGKSTPYRSRPCGAPGGRSRPFETPGGSNNCRSQAWQGWVLLPDCQPGPHMVCCPPEFGGFSDHGIGAASRSRKKGVPFS